MTSIDDKQETAGLLFYTKYLHTDAIGSLVNIDCAWRLSCLVVERRGRNRKKELKSFSDIIDQQFVHKSLYL